MQLWEYMTIQARSGIRSEEDKGTYEIVLDGSERYIDDRLTGDYVPCGEPMQLFLNRMGKIGWELIGFTETNGGVYGQVVMRYYVFKRPIENTPPSGGPTSSSV